MRIGIDLRSLEGGAQHRGIGRYVTELLHALSKIDNKNEYVFFLSHHASEAPKLSLADTLAHSFQHGRGQGLRGVKYVRIIFITPRPLAIDRYKLDVFFHVDIQQPIRARSTPVVSVVYDLIPYIYEDLYQQVHLGGYTPGHLIGYSRMRLKWRVQKRWLQNYRNDARIISISEHTKKDLLKFLPGLTPKKVVSIPLAAGSLPAVNKAAKASMARLKLKDFFFYVGGADPRKGLVDLARSFEEVWQEFPDAQLVLAGKEVTRSDVPEAVKLTRAVSKLSRPKQVFLLGFISDEELAWLYHNAKAFVFPSRYEGFGLPVLEAMQAGCPVITYDNSSLPEVAAGSAITLPDGSSMVPAMCDILRNGRLRDQLIKKGYDQAKQFTWQRTAEETLSVLEAAAKEGA